MKETETKTPVSDLESQNPAGEEAQGPELSFSPVLPPLDLDGLSKQTIDLAQVDWKPVDPRYLTLRFIFESILTFVCVGLSFLPLVMTLFYANSDWPIWACYALPALVALWRIWALLRTAPWVRALGYSERADHLLKRSGLLFKTVTALPYGRIQYVDVSSGPLENAFSLASLKVKTAASTLTIPGLNQEEAQRLREILTELSDAKRVGL